MIQLERIQQLHALLEQQPATVIQLLAALKGKGFKVEKRQLYWDLLAMEKHYLRAGETLFMETGQYNKRTYILKQPILEKAIAVFDINTYQLCVKTLPIFFNSERAASLKKFKTILDRFVLQNRKSTYTYLEPAKLMSTHFYESSFDGSFHQSMEDLIWAIAQNKIISIEALRGDATSLHQQIKVPFNIKPVSIIYHRGDFILSGFDTHSHIFTTINISKISSYQLLNTTFAYKRLQQQAQQILSERFGITNNINNKVYQIELEFSSATGDFVSKYHWHTSQIFTELPNGNYRCTFNCGINRELVGWIFHWMNNVRIIKPKLLKEFYQQQLDKMNQLQQAPSSLIYSNIFQPEIAANE